MEIEKGIPMPEHPNGQTGHKRTGRPEKYRFKEMEIGDSMFIPNQNMRGGAWKSARRYGQKTGKMFCAEALSGGVRIWRVS